MKKHRNKNHHRFLGVLSLLCGAAIFGAILLMAVSCRSAGDIPPVEVVPDTTAYLEMENNNRSATGTGIIDVPYLNQSDDLITGCELVSAAMVLQYYGYRITPEEFARNYVTMESLEEVDGQWIGPHPQNAFVGDPYSFSGYGCYAPVIVESMNRVTNGTWQATNTTGTSLNTLCDTYVQEGTPVLVWVTIQMAPSYESESWQIRGTDDWFTWRAREHCMVLVGEEENQYLLLDPYNNNGLVRYDKDLVQQRFLELGQQSVVLQ